MDNYRKLHSELADAFHALSVALYQYETGAITQEAYNAKLEETIQYLQSIKFTPNTNS